MLDVLYFHLYPIVMSSFHTRTLNGENLDKTERRSIRSEISTG